MTIRTDVLKTEDVAQIALQRTKGLLEIPGLGRPSLIAWKRGLSLPLRIEAAVRRMRVLKSALEFVERDFELLKTHLGGHTARGIVDIGCGHALIDLHLYRHYDAPEILLIDVEATSDRYLGYAETAAGYASLSQAKAFLVSNGVPAQKVWTLNPRTHPLPECKADLIVSFLSAGFHYPIEQYKEFIMNSLGPGGVLVFDLNKEIDESGFLGDFRSVRCIRETEEARKLLCVR